MAKLRRTKQGLTLEKLLHGMKHRYVLCWNGDDYSKWGGAYDCACCITYLDSDDPENVTRQCGCNCHWIIEEMATGRYAAMWLLALAASEEMPFIPKNYEDQMAYSRKIKIEHDQWRAEGNPSSAPNNPKDCCENCKLVIGQDERYEEHKASPEKHHRKDERPEDCFICNECSKHAPIKVQITHVNKDGEETPLEPL